MNVTVIGTGYVGLVVGACLAETGNHVVCADVDDTKIDMLNGGSIPIHEPGLDVLVARSKAARRLAFTTDVGKAIERADVVFIAVGTPPDEDGSADLQHVLAVATMIGDHMNTSKVVITKSTVPVGTAKMVRDTIGERTDREFYVCANPEFLKEGSAVNDFMKPDRVVIGVDAEEPKRILSDLYEPFIRTGNPLIFMDIASAELTKYAANAMLASRISFMNQVAELCERVGADVRLVRKGIGTDPRIGPAFLFPGPGYGGSCFPKDVRALLKTAGDHGVDLELLQAVDDVNVRQKQRMFVKLTRIFDGSVEGRTVAVWGLAFKAETDDIRESPAVDLVSALVQHGARVRVHDPVAMPNARKIFGDTIDYFDDPYDALDGADALAVATEWLAFRTPDFDTIAARLRQKIIVDGRNLYRPERIRGLGFRYSCIGCED